MLSVILDFKTDGLDVKGCNLLAFSYILIDNKTSEAISSMSQLIIPQHQIDNHEVIPASEGNLLLGWDLESAKEMMIAILNRTDLTHIIVANIEFDLGIITNKLGINIANKVFIDLNTDTPTLNSRSDKTAVNKDTCLDMLGHINSMYEVVKKHSVSKLIEMKTQPKRVYSLYIDKHDNYTSQFYSDLGFTFNQYYGKHIAWLRDNQFRALLKRLYGYEQHKKELEHFKKQHDNYLGIK